MSAEPAGLGAALGPLPPEWTPGRLTADVLDSAEASAIAQQTVIRHLAAVKKGLMQRLVSKGIDHKRLKSCPAGEIPLSWDVKSLGEIAALTSGKAKPQDTSHLRSGAHSVPVYGANGLLGYSSASLQKGSTIAIGRVGAHCGDVHYVSAEASWITDSALFIYQTRPEVDLLYLSYSLCRLDLSALRNMGRQPLLSLAALYPVPLPIPPLEEQREICRVLLDFEDLCEAQDRVYAQMKRIRSVLLELMTAEGV